MRMIYCLIGVLLPLGSIHTEPVSLLDGKLKFDTTDAFVRDNDSKKSTKQSIANFSARNSDGWGAITRGTHGLQPDGLKNYMDREVAEYTKGLSWLPKLSWLKKEIVTVNGRRWADMIYMAPRENAKDARDGLLYTRIFGTSYKGQLLEFIFTSNTDPSPLLKDKIDKVIESVKVED
jgi:hypothetical protein